MANKHMVYFSWSVIEATVTDKASVANKWVREILSLHNGQQIIVGLDCEWRPNIISSMKNKTATLQLCVGTKCLILQMFYMDYIPQSIKSFLSDPNVTFVGVEVRDDVSKLRDEYGLSCSNTVDIQALAMERRPVRFFRTLGLKKLAYEVVWLSMAKPMHVCRSNWEARVLDEKQVEYASIDVSKLRDEYGLSCSNTVDIQALAMERRPVRFYRTLGLKKLAYEVVWLSMAKPMHVCRSNWEARVLDEKQVEYVSIDVSKLRDEYGLSCSNTVDIQALAMERRPVRFYRTLGLKKLAYEVVWLSMAKPMHVCRSNWEARVLDEKQVEYASIDAYKRYRIGLNLLKGM